MYPITYHKMSLAPSSYSSQQFSFLERYSTPYPTYSSDLPTTSGITTALPRARRARSYFDGTRKVDDTIESFSVSSQHSHPRSLRSASYVSESPRRSVTRSRSHTEMASNYSARPTSLSRRVYPQSYSAIVESEDSSLKDDSSVVFNANLSFVLDMKSRMRQNFTPVPAYLEKETSSNALSKKISMFLQKTDHVMDEWRKMGRIERKPISSMNNSRYYLDKSRSVTNIMIKGFQYYSRADSVTRNSLIESLSADCNTDADLDELSEMTADLAEENSTATLAGERLDAEIAERLRLETELSEHKQKNKELQQTSERLEMELLYARSDLNGMSEENEDDNDGDGVYQKRYERVLKELEFTKRRLQQQHEDDLEQLVGLKKQLEKKLADAYEEVEEQRQVVGTWKRKVQKLTGEMNDLKMLLEEQNSRNNLLEKKQRKYDSDASTLHEELKKERQAKERLYREKEALIAEKYVVDSTVSEIQLELDLKEEKLAALQREFDEITCGGKTEEEVTILRKQKIDLERRLQDQEEELDELAGQVQLLEQVKLRLEMTLESIRKESKKESQTREEELEEVRCTAQRKVKALEQQLENEHEDRTTLLREKHELERRLQAAADSERNDRAGDEAVFHRLKRDLKRVKALLRDAHAQLERQKAEIPGKNVLRQLRNQVEDLEYARAIAVKTKQSLEQELSEMQSLLDEAHKQKSDAEDKATALLREKSDIQTQLEENEEELAEVLKKYKAAVQQMSIDQMSLQEQVALVSELEIERNHLKEQLADITSRLESAETMGGASSNLLYKRSELKIKDLESKLELEQTTRSRLEVQITRLKETVERLQSDLTSSRIKEQQAQDQVRKLQRQMRELKEELNKSLAKESEVIIKKKELEKRCETLEAECSTSRTDLRLALKRIEDLQSVIQGDLEDSVSNESESEEESSGGSFQSSMIMEKDGSPKAQVRRSSTNHSIASGSIEKDSSYA